MDKGKRKFRLPKSLRLLFIGVLTFNLLWWLFAVIFQNKALPNPLDVYAIFPKTLSEGMFAHAVASLRRIVIGTAIALFFGLLGGLLTGLSKRANKMLNPLLYLSYPVPKLALLPVVMIIFGIIFLIMQEPLRKSQWNLFLNPFNPPYDVNETTWAIITLKNRIILIVGIVIFLLASLLNLQKREKFM